MSFSRPIFNVGFIILSGLLGALAELTVIQTPWATLETTDKDRVASWVTYESRQVVGLHFTTAPTSIPAALMADNYGIQSSQDPSYATPKPPTSVSYRSRVIFAALSASPNYLDPLRFGYHVFLQLPTPLQDGMSYTFTATAAPFGAEATFTLNVNEGQQLNTNIRVNQVGYLLAGPKLGFAGAWLGSSTATSPYVHVALQLPYGTAGNFTVQDAATGAVVFVGTPRLYVPVATTTGAAGAAAADAPDLYTGQQVWQLDFSPLATPGRYVLRVPGLGLSHPFRVAADALRPALGVLARGVYGQRCGVALSNDYLAPWGATRPEACHTADAEVMPVDPPPAWFVNRMPLPNPTPNMTTLPAVNGSYFLPQLPAGSRIYAVGGHHDAGDYGKYTVSSSLMVGWLMIGLEVMRAEWDDLPLPEAGDGVPDIMQEVEWELTFLEGMQDADGGVYCVVKPNTTAGDYYEGNLPCGTPGRDACNLPAGSPRRGPRIAWPKDTTCTAQFAAVMARAARSPWFRKLRPAAADRYLSRARAAWSYLTSVAPVGALCYHFYGCMGGVTAAEATRPAYERTYNCYDPQGDQSSDERIWAAVELYGATGEAAFHSYFLERHCPRFRRWGWQALPFSYGPATVTYAELTVRARNGEPGALPVNSTVGQRCLDELAAVARGHMAEAATNPYGLALPTSVCRVFGYGWHFPAEPAAHLMVAAALAASNSSEAASWRDLASQQMHYILGANPQGFSLISGIGARRIRNVVDQESSYDDLDPAWPGLPIGMASGFSWLNQYGSALGAAFPPGIDYPALHRSGDVFNVNTEFAVHWMAMTLGVVAALAGNASQSGSSAGLTPPPAFTLDVAPGSGPAPLSVQFTAKVEGDPGRVAYLEFDFGDGGHSYQGQPVHVYVEPGRAFYGTATAVFTDGQAATRSFAVFTSWPADVLPSLPPPEGLAAVARLASDVSPEQWGGPLPPLRVATSLSGGPDSGGAVFTGSATAGAAASAANLAWQGPRTAWTGSALSFYRFEDTANYSLVAPAASGSGSTAVQAFLAAAWGGLALEAWIYPAKFLSYGRGNAPLLGLQQGRNRFFGLQGSIWSGNQVVMGTQVVANETHLGPRLTPGRWHHIRLAVSPALEPSLALPAGSPGACSVWVDGQLAVTATGGSCSSQKVLDYCGSGAGSLGLVAGSFRGYVDGLRIFGSPAVSSLGDVCGPTPPPPSPPRAPPSPAPDNRFYPLTPDSFTLALLDTDAACGLYGDALVAAIPLRLYTGGAATGSALLPTAATFPAGLSASADGLPADGNASTTEVGNTRWMRQPAGCSLRLGSQAVRGGGAALTWQVPAAALAAARAAGALSIDAKLFVESWRTGYSFWNSDVLGLMSNWDTYFKLSYDLWTNARLLLSSPAASTTGAFSGIFLNTSLLEAALPAGCWHHLALTANASGCALAVDGVEVVATSGCNATRLLPAGGTGAMAVSVGGIRGWVDELQLSAAWRPTQRPGQINGSTALAAQQYSGGVASGLLPVAEVGSPVLLTPLGAPSFNGHGSSCAVLLNASACGSCAYIKYNMSSAALSAVKDAGAMTLDAKLYVTKWVNYGVDNSDPVLGWMQAWDRYFKVTSDKWQMVRALVKAPATATTAQSLYGGEFVLWSPLNAALTPNTWHHVALAINTTTCTLYVDGAAMTSPVRCNLTAMVNFAAWSTVGVGGFQGLVADLRLSSGWRVGSKP